MASINNNVKELKKEVKLLRSFVIGQIGKDAEGEYRPEFVEKILRASGERPVYHFKGKHSFLIELARRKSS